MMIPASKILISFVFGRYFACYTFIFDAYYYLTKRFLQNSQGLYPLLWRVALDILPAQASAVPCEQIFSSSKETDTGRRSNLSSFKMEELQMLKFGYRNDRMSFTDDLVCTERELSVLDMSRDVVEDLLAHRKLEELQQYIEESWKGWGAEKE